MEINHRGLQINFDIQNLMNNNSAGGRTVTHQLAAFPQSTKSTKRLRPPASVQQFATPGIPSSKSKVHNSNNAQGISRRLSPGANLIAASSACGAALQHNFNRYSSNNLSSGRVGTQSVSSLHAVPQQSSTTSTRSKKHLPTKSPEVPTTIKNSGGKQATTVAFETWINAICPPSNNNSQTTRKNAIKAASAMKHLAPKSHAQAFTSVSQPQQPAMMLEKAVHNNAIIDQFKTSADEERRLNLKPEHLNGNNHNIAVDQKLDEISMKSIHLQNGFSSSNDFYPSDSGRDFDNTDTVLQTMTNNTSDPDLQSSSFGMQSPGQKGLPRSPDELDKINHKLAQEYKYVENLRKNLRQAELRHEEAIKIAISANPAVADTFPYQKQTQQERKNVKEESNETSDKVLRSDQQQVIVHSSDFWSEQAHISRSKNRKFTLEPPTEQLKEDKSLKGSNFRKSGSKGSTVSKKGQQQSSADQTTALTASSRTLGQITQQYSFCQITNDSSTSTQQQRSRMPKKQQKPTSTNNVNLCLDEQQVNQQKNNLKKAVSPINKNTTISQRFTNSNQDQALPSKANTNFQATPSIITSTGKSMSMKALRTDQNRATPPATRQQPRSNVLKSAKCPAPKQSFIGTGLFRKSQQHINNNLSDKQVPLWQKNRLAQPSTELCHAFQGAPRCRDQSLQSSDDPSKTIQDHQFGGEHLDKESNKKEERGERKQQSDLNIAPTYDFDKYEMISTQHQIQDLLSKKLDTPKGSSASEEDNGPNIHLEEDNEPAGPSAQKIMNSRPQNQSILQQQNLAQKAYILGASPEPKHKHMSSLFTKQRTERKVTATSQILKVNDRVKQAQSPQSRNAQQMSICPGRTNESKTQAVTVLGGGITQCAKGSTSSSFLGKACQNDETSSPPIKQTKQARLDNIQTQQAKRTNIFQKSPPQPSNSNSTTQIASSQQQQQSVAATLQGSPAVPPLHKAVQRASHKSNNSFSVMIQSPDPSMSSKSTNGQAGATSITVVQYIRKRGATAQ